MRYLDDFRAGQVFRFRSAPTSTAAIKAFALKWGPQPLHTDDVYAAGMHGSFIASGFQTMLEVFRPIMAELMVDVANIGGIGFDNLRWLKPFCSEESLDVEMIVNSVTPWRSKPDRRRSMAGPTRSSAISCPRRSSDSPIESTSK